MSYCGNCGQKLDEGAKFCFNCGHSVDIANRNKRRTVYDGETHQCQSCGAILDSFMTHCPNCKNEFRGTQSSSVMQEFVLKLENAGVSQRITIIKNFAVPNNRENIFEFMSLACANFDPTIYASHLEVEDESDAWLAKIEQCYNQAHLLLKNPAELQKIDDLYNKAKKDCRDKCLDYKRETSTNAFKKGIFKYILFGCAACFAFLTALAFHNEKDLAGTVSAIMMTLSIMAILMGYGVIKERIVNIRIAVFLVALVLLIPYICLYLNSTWSFKDLDKNVVKIGISSEELMQKGYSGAEEYLKDKGFASIVLDCQEWYEGDEEGKVTCISINGKTSFSEGERFENSSNVKITYIGHKEKIKVGYNSHSLIGLDRDEVLEKLESRDFRNIKVQQVDWEYGLSEGKVTEVSVNGTTSFVSSDRFNMETPIVIFYVGDAPKVAVGFNASDLRSLSYNEVFERLSSQGFTDIKIKEKEWNSNYEEGEVVEVSIDGQISFTSYDNFKVNVPVVITYIKDAPKVSVGLNSSDLIGLPCNEALEKLRLRGFSNIKIVEIEWSENYVGGEVTEISFNGNTNFLSEEIFKVNIPISVTYVGSPQQITIGYNSNDLVGFPYTEVLESLRAQGFINVEIQEIEWNQSLVEGEVTEVSIDGKTKFVFNDCFKMNAPILITYVGGPKEIFVGYNSGDLIGKTYNEAFEMLKEQGFTNVEFYVQPWDPSQDSLTIKGVTIDGSDDFSSNTIYVQNVKIILTYYEAAPNILLEYSSEDLIGKDYEEVKESLEKLGFVNIVLHGEKLNFQLGKGHTVREVKINGSSNFESGQLFSADSCIEIYYYYKFLSNS